MASRYNPYSNHDTSRGRSSQTKRQNNFRQLYNSLNLTRKQEIILLVVFSLLVLVWFLTPASDYVSNIVLLTVPLDADVQLGYESLNHVEQKYPIVKDYWDVERIGWNILRHSKKDWNSQIQGYNWSFKVVHADFANAFALPGGPIRITDSLLKQLNLSDGEIAALIGHEIGHVLNRHSMKRIIKSKLFGTIMEGLTYEDNDDHQENFGEAIGEILLRTASYLGELGFSRRDEYEADSTSWDLLIRSKMNPNSVSSMLRKLWQLEGGTGKTQWESTHPGTKDR